MKNLQTKYRKIFLNSRVPEELDGVSGDGPFDVEKEDTLIKITDLKVVENADGRGDSLQERV